jgi:crotonobetainyl-CoA:carnitine CoA-transferase CaiB-like acyl-CoA transferase
MAATRERYGQLLRLALVCQPYERSQICRLGHPLAGITVVELGHSVAAPYAGLILADLGARVIKVENPKGGDYARGWGPPLWKGTASLFVCLNRGKEGITVDFGQEDQVRALRALILEEADAVA